MNVRWGEEGLERWLRKVVFHWSNNGVVRPSEEVPAFTGPCAASIRQLGKQRKHSLFPPLKYCSSPQFSVAGLFSNTNGNASSSTEPFHKWLEAKACVLLDDPAISFLQKIHNKGKFLVNFKFFFFLTMKLAKFASARSKVGFGVFVISHLNVSGRPSSRETDGPGTSENLRRAYLQRDKWSRCEWNLGNR